MNIYHTYVPFLTFATAVYIYWSDQAFFAQVAVRLGQTLDWKLY